jgi:DNA-binding GntR family transcriptional regulator
MRQAKAPEMNGSRADLAYDSIRDAITSGHYGSGQRMREAEMAHWLGISRTPVRDALRRLEAESLLVAAPRRGLVVAELDEHQLADLFAVRTALASLAARLAAEHATANEIATMKEVIEHEGATPAKDFRSSLKMNNLFHQLVYKAARNTYLNQVLGSLEASLALIPARTFIGSKRPALAVRQHRGLVDAIAARNPDLAEKRARTHMVASEQILHSMLSTGGELVGREQTRRVAAVRRSRDIARAPKAPRRPKKR